MYSSTVKQPCYIEQDNGLASLKDIDLVGHRANNFVTKSMITMGYSNRTSFKNLSILSSPRSGARRFYDTRFEDHQPHFLEACSLCNKSLGDNKDIFMYRGDTPFCSEECRQEQIEIDELKEKNMNLSSSMKVLRIKEQRNSTNKVQGQDYSFRTGTVIAA
ncbi:FCS-Like Zinc finger 3-like [Trifolium pratense]|uniref:FCS-Like Zinc finger 3-like n=1 Tax=Trifolium pratense TaxID=57577 RepID=UPI001E693A5D|nr:FCS-Like Zinc finger 3-like [Trifolium pratense]